MHMMEEFIAEATGLPTQGECWFKKKLMFTNIDQFLMQPSQELDWTLVIARKYLKPEWDSILKLVQAFITCEGRFSIVYLY